MPLRELLDEERTILRLLIEAAKAVREPLNVTAETFRQSAVLRAYKLLRYGAVGDARR